MGDMEIKRLQPGDEPIVLSADLFDHPPTPEWTERFLSTATHHLLMAIADDLPVGFVSGVETIHPDKGSEMFLYELGVHSEHRKRGVGTALVRELAVLARERGCYGMWVLTQADNAIALATYRAAGSTPPDSTLMLSWDFAGAERRGASN